MKIILLVLIAAYCFGSSFSKDKAKEENRIIKNINANNSTVAEIHCIEELVFLRDIKNNSFIQVFGQNSKPLKCEDIKLDDKK